MEDFEFNETYYYCSSYKQKIIKSGFQNQFTPSQVRAIVKRKRVRWGVQDITQGLMIRTISRRAHQYIRRNKIFPLPALSTLRKWVQRFDCVPGIQVQVLKVLKEQMKSEVQSSFRIASLAFDEMDIQKGYQYDHKEDKVLGPNKKLQLVVARGIISHWKQQIFFDFDKPMTKELLFSIICSAEQNEIKVYSVVCDLGNQGLLKSLGVSQETPFFENPYDSSRKVYVFADAPHLLKLIRNHLVDKGYILEDGTEINIEDVQKILAKDASELRIHHKLSPIHFNCTQGARQRVCLAAQLLSHTTATAVKCLFPEKSELSNWIEMFDQWFDIFNSRVAFHTKRMACGFGVHFEEQNSVLEKTFSCIQTMREKGRKSLLPFQKGFLLSIRALQELFSDLKKNYKIDYLLTSRLNQDSAENTFSQIRGIGSPHPGPVDCKNRLRLILLGKNGSIFIKNPAVLLDENEQEPECPLDPSVLILKKVVSSVHPEPV